MADKPRSPTRKKDRSLRVDSQPSRLERQLWSQAYQAILAGGSPRRREGQPSSYFQQPLFQTEE